MFKDFLDMLFPRTCLTCNGLLEKNEEMICTHCRFELPQTDFHLEQDNPLARKFWGRVPLKYAFAYLRFVKTGKVQTLLHHLKYYGKEEVGDMLGKWYGNELRKKGFEGEFDLILPVPLHLSKLRKRGYNQCDSIARGLAEGLQIDWSNSVLLRKQANISQTKKDRVERWENVESIFEVINPQLVENKNILIVDDVITTGATLEACCVPLQKAGCRSLSIASLAVGW